MRALRPEQGEWDDADAIATPVRRWSGRENQRVGKAISEPVSEPHQVAHVTIIHRRCQLHLDGDDAATALEHEIHFVRAILSAQVKKASLRRLRVGLDAEGHEPLEEATQRSTVLGADHRALSQHG